ncbi:MAG: hypothetical protein JWO98_83 [Frankiales bacterium]|nr:hypothetical protein [Frankiales bacterium]
MLAGEGGTGCDEVGGAALEDDPTAVGPVSVLVAELIGSPSLGRGSRRGSDHYLFMTSSARTIPIETYCPESAAPATAQNRPDGTEGSGDTPAHRAANQEHLPLEFGQSLRRLVQPAAQGFPLRDCCHR